MNKNIRISLAIFIIALLTLLSGLFEEEKKATVIKKELFTVATSISTAVAYQPLIKLKSTTISETRVEVKAKTSGEVVRIGSRQGDFIQKDSILCSLGIVELNRTEVKAPFSGYIEKIVKPGNFLERGQICATIIQLNPITFVAEVPESDINKVTEGQQVKTDQILCLVDDSVKKRWLSRLEDGNGDLSAIADAFNILHHRFVSIIRIVPSKRLLLARLSTSNPRTNIKPKNIPAAKAKYKTSFIQTTSIISFYY